VNRTHPYILAGACSPRSPHVIERIAKFYRDALGAKYFGIPKPFLSSCYIQLLGIQNTNAVVTNFIGANPET
jgi:hypothetical protein